MISWITARDILATLRRNDRLHGHSFMINIMKDLETALNNKKKNTRYLEGNWIVGWGVTANEQ